MVKQAAENIASFGEEIKVGREMDFFSYVRMYRLNRLNDLRELSLT